MFNNILLPIDHTATSSWKTALPLAREESKLREARLSVICIIPEILKLPNLPDNYGDGAAAHVEAELRTIIGDDLSIMVRQGSIYREILKEAHASDVDLIILASPKGNFPDYRLHTTCSAPTRPVWSATPTVRC